jgi:hypothetical protein
MHYFFFHLFQFLFVQFEFVMYLFFRFVYLIEFYMYGVLIVVGHFQIEVLLQDELFPLKKYRIRFWDLFI